MCICIANNLVDETCLVSVYTLQNIGINKGYEDDEYIRDVF